MDTNRKEELVGLLYQEKERLSNVTTAHITYKNGRRGEGDVVCTFDSDDTNYQYFLFRDGTKTPDGLWITYVARYDVINSVLQKKGFELGEVFDIREILMIQDVIENNLAKGILRKKPVLSLKLDGIASVDFS